MADNIKDNKIKEEEQQQPIKAAVDADIDYIKAIQELKANSVPREQYSKLKDENSKLLKSIINGESDIITSTSANSTIVDEETKIKELRKDLFSGNSQHMSNLEYISKMLDLRNKVIEQGGQDPFLPHGSKVMPDNNDIECANRVATVLEECIEYAEGDSQIFTNELQRRMIDAAPKNRK